MLQLIIMKHWNISQNMRCNKEDQSEKQILKETWCRFFFSPWESFYQIKTRGLIFQYEGWGGVGEMIVVSPPVAK